MVEGDIVKIQLSDDITRFRIRSFRGPVGSARALHSSTHGAYVDVDSDGEAVLTQGGIEKPTPAFSTNAGRNHDALVLILQQDSRLAPTRGRLVLMLLRWVADGRAERLGLLSSHAEGWDTETLNSLEVDRRSFILA